MSVFIGGLLWLLLMFVLCVGGAALNIWWTRNKPFRMDNLLIDPNKPLPDGITVLYEKTEEDDEEELEDMRRSVAMM